MIMSKQNRVRVRAVTGIGLGDTMKHAAAARQRYNNM
jgi:hypothetical protein